MEIGDEVLFLVDPGTSRERRVGEVTATEGEGAEEMLTIAAAGGPYQRLANLCLRRGRPPGIE